MATIVQDWCGGLEPEIDGQMFTERPSDPEMRESASIWLYDEKGEFAIPRIGIEAVGTDWDTHRYDANFAFADGRVLRESARAPTLPSVGADGKASLLGAGGLQFRCIEPFRKWAVSYDGQAYDGAVEEQIRSEFAVFADGSRNRGLEGRKRLSFMPKEWGVFTFIGNVSAIDSKVKLTSDQANKVTTIERPLQGQAPWVLNLALEPGYSTTNIVETILHLP